MNICQRAIYMSNNWGKDGKRKCGRNATHTQPGGLPVCEHHYNKYIKKRDKKYKLSVPIAGVAEKLDAN